MEYDFLVREQHLTQALELPDVIQKRNVFELQERSGIPTELLFEQQPQEQNVFHSSPVYHRIQNISG